MNTHIFFKKASVISVLIVVLTSSCFIAGCQKEEDIDDIKAQIVYLAQKYGMNISFNEISSSKIINISSIEELEFAFQQIAEQRRKNVTRNIYLKSSNNGFLSSKTNEIINNSIRLKNGTEGWNSSNWFYDLTWFNVDIAYSGNPNTMQIISYYSGISLYSYVQNLAYVTHVDGSGTIYFEIRGVESTTWGLFGIDIYESRSIGASGTYNPLNGTGSVSLAGNGYWSY